ncbi:MAG TPA: DUF2252 domain-containing protein [Mycobacteriales bacterium]|jgi:uncharacterized protein (DUF2252 family)
MSPAEREAFGKAARAAVPRSSHAELGLGPARPDPVDLLIGQGESRVQDLLPIRYGRMLASPFSFYRGAALVMASDLSGTPRTGIRTQICGDAHLSNFGVFASPERQLVFDINDFDETLPGPWEWDLKRLAASLAVAGRDRNFDAAERAAIVMQAAREYRESMLRFAPMSNLEVWYARQDLDDVKQLARETAGPKDKKQAKRLDKSLEKARSKDSMKAFEKLTHVVDGQPRIISDPPLIVPIAELLPDLQRAAFQEETLSLLRSYRRTLPSDRRVLLESFRFGDFARKVVGVGSVGTRCWIVLLFGRDEKDPLFLQVKEAEASVLEQFVGRSEYHTCGHRVVAGQQLMQTSSDIFLGWERATGIDGVERDFYIRQLYDWKGSADIDRMVPKGMGLYARLCGWALARAHARAGDRIAIAAYLGKGQSFDRAIVAFAENYADQNARDFENFKKAAESGRITAQFGV